MPNLAAVSRPTIDPKIIRAAAQHFELAPEALVFVRDVANVVYQAGDRFLRLTHRDDHTENLVRAEIDWLQFLVAEGLPVCRPAPAKTGEFVMRASEEFTAVVFERVRGRPIGEDEYDEEIFEQMGRFMGRLHQVSERFEPSDPSCVRPHAREFESLDFVLGSWEPDDYVVADAWRRTYERIDRAEGPTGLIHGDVHRGNIFRHEDGIDVIDFDDSCNFLLAADISNALFYSLWFRQHDPPAERTRCAERFLSALLRGYRAERAFRDGDLALLPDLLDYRDLTVDAFSHRRKRKLNADLKRRYGRVRERFRRGTPYVDLDGTG